MRSYFSVSARFVPRPFTKKVRAFPVHKWCPILSSRSFPVSTVTFCASKKIGSEHQERQAVFITGVALGILIGATLGFLLSSLIEGGRSEVE